MANQAAWIKEKKGKPFIVDDAELYKPGPGQVVIKNAAVAINPVDGMMQDIGLFYEKYPNIFGSDIAGEIVDIGEGVTKLKKGQRVISHTAGIDTQEPRDGAFQQFSIGNEIVTTAIPDSMSYEQAAVVPLALSTAACGLYQKDHLNLPLPSKNPKPSGKTLLLWGGSSSVGSMVIQLAIASGLKVVATASAKNHDYVKSLGATAVVDYNSPKVVDELVAEIRKVGELAGIYDALSKPETFKAVVAVGEQLGGARVAAVLEAQQEIFTDKVTTNKAMIMAMSLYRQSPDVADAVWQKWLPEALAEGRLLPKPDPLVFGAGLSSVQGAVDRHKEGVSAAKVAVRL